MGGKYRAVCDDDTSGKVCLLGVIKEITSIGMAAT